MKINNTNTLDLWKSICLNDDLRAFEQLFHTLNTKLIKFCIIYIRQREAAEDIVSEVFIRCWELRQSLMEVTNPETYLFVAVKNQSLNYIKKYSSIHLVQTEDSNELEFVDKNNPERELELKELQFILDKAISSLPQQASLVFRLIKEDGLRYKEVAEILNISPRTVQTQLFRAIKKLSIILSHHQLLAKQSKRTVSYVSVPDVL